MTPQNNGHRKRLREKYSRFGHDTLFDYEKIELLLTYAVPRMDVKPLAKELLTKFGGIAGIMEASPEELMLVPGVGESIVNLITLVRNLGADFHKEHLIRREIFSCSGDVIRYLKMKMAGLGKEAFLVIYLNTRNEVIDSEFLGDGTIDQVFIHTRELLIRALNHKARAIILVHNHPAGTVLPSREDIQLTKNIRSAGLSMKIDLLDHLIITHDAAYSIILNKRINLGEEDEYMAMEYDSLAAEWDQKNYDNLPFHPRRLNRPVSEIIGGTFGEQENL